MTDARPARFSVFPEEREMAEERPVDLRRTNYPFNFPSPPKIGSKIVYWGGVVLTLVSVTPYVRKDGGESALLTWIGPDGRVLRSGLRSKGATVERITT
jgi:hypothetical protein